MINNPTLKEFEASVTTRLLLDRLVDVQHVRKERYPYEVAASQAVYAANDLLKDIGINHELWVRIRGKRLYMFHEQSHRIVAEVCVITDDAGESYGRKMRKNLRIELMGRGGSAVKEPTIGDLAVSIQARPRPFRNRNNNFKRQEVAHHG